MVAAAVAALVELLLLARRWRSTSGRCDASKRYDDLTCWVRKRRYGEGVAEEVSSRSTDDAALWTDQKERLPDSRHGAAQTSAQAGG